VKGELVGIGTIQSALSSDCRPRFNKNRYSGRPDTSCNFNSHAPRSLNKENFKMADKNPIDDLQKVRETLVKMRQNIAASLSAAFSEDGIEQFTKIQTAIKAVDRAIKDEEPIKRSFLDDPPED
jgi:hypothetical protein